MYPRVNVCIGVYEWKGVPTAALELIDTINNSTRLINIALIERKLNYLL